MASKTKGQFRTAIDNRLKQVVNTLEPAEKDEATEDALGEYSKDKPQRTADDITGDAGFDYELNTTNLAGYEDGFSWITEIEYPYDSDSAGHNTVADDNWEIYNSGSAKYLRFLVSEPSTSETIRVHYTIPYEFSDAGSVTLPLTDYRAVCNLAAAKTLRSIAAKFVATGDSTLSADIVNYRSKSREALDLAKKYEDDYRAYMGITKDAPAPAASITIDQDTEDSWGEAYLTHPARHR